MELKNNLKDKKPFKVIYDNEDFGKYTYSILTKRYEGEIGYLDIKTMIEIINGAIEFINLEIPNEQDSGSSN